MEKVPKHYVEGLCVPWPVPEVTVSSEECNWKIKTNILLRIFNKLVLIKAGGVERFRWSGNRFKFCVIYIAIVTLTFFINGDNGGNVGLAITQALGMTGMVQWGMLENTMTSVERVVEYETVDPEPALDADDGKKPPKEWPQEGRVKFDKLSLSYQPDPDSDRVLKGLEFQIQPREKIRIVGRTDAGKSCLVNALFRLSYNEGSIVIDTRDIHMGLHDLRGKLSIIPQETVLYSGTLRCNLDPFDEYPDEKLWRALKEVKLEDAVNELPSGLYSKID